MEVFFRALHTDHFDLFLPHFKQSQTGEGVALGGRAAPRRGPQREDGWGARGRARGWWKRTFGFPILEDGMLVEHSTAVSTRFQCQMFWCTQKCDFALHAPVETLTLPGIILPFGME